MRVIQVKILPALPCKNTKKKQPSHLRGWKKRIPQIIPKSKVSWSNFLHILSLLQQLPKFVNPFLGIQTVPAQFRVRRAPNCWRSLKGVYLTKPTSFLPSRLTWVDVGFVNQNSGFVNQRFDNQGSTTKNGGFVNQGSSTKKSDSSTKRFVNQKSWIRQPKTADSSTKVRQPRFVNQGSSTKNTDSSTKNSSTKNGGFVNQGSSTKNTDSSTKHSSTKRLDSSTKNGGFVNQVSSTKTTDSSTKISSTKRLDSSKNGGFEGSGTFLACLEVEKLSLTCRCCLSCS